MVRRLGRVAVRAARFDGELMLAMMIYVGNLDYATTSEELRVLFEPFGAVTMAEVQVKARTGQSRGFGMVDMPRPAEAEAAISALNGRDFKERALVVNESRPRRTVRDLYAGGGWFGGGHGG
jgi:RNA recognition motif-containing protein